MRVCAPAGVRCRQAKGRILMSTRDRVSAIIFHLWSESRPTAARGQSHPGPRVQACRYRSHTRAVACTASAQRTTSARARARGTHIRIRSSPTVCDPAIVPASPRSEPREKRAPPSPHSPPNHAQKNWASQRKPSAYPILRITEHMKTSIGRTFVSRSPLLSFPYVSNKPSA